MNVRAEDRSKQFADILKLEIFKTETSKAEFIAVSCFFFIYLD